MQPGIRKTLYSELGIRENATREEIRTAYRDRAKEIHPDKALTEEERTAAAERMAALNNLMAVLGDDPKRADYDLELDRQRKAEKAALLRLSGLTREALRRAESGILPRRRVPAWLWFGGLIGLVAAGSAIILIRENRESSAWASRPVNQVVDRPPGDRQSMGNSRPVDSVREPLGAKAPIRQVEKTNSLSRFEPARGSADDPPAIRESPLVEEARRALTRKPPAEQRVESAAVQTISPPPTPLNNPGVPPQTIAPEPPRSMAALVAAAPAVVKHGALEPPDGWQGYWKYSEASGGGVGGAFTPVNIELFLQEKGQRIVGYYKASYRETQKYSDRVEFTLDAPNTDSRQLGGVWSDTMGDRGEFKIKKIDARVIQMNWWTTKLARKYVLASGSARLMEAGGY